MSGKLPTQPGEGGDGGGVPTNADQTRPSSSSSLEEEDQRDVMYIDVLYTCTTEQYSLYCIV